MKRMLFPFLMTLGLYGCETPEPTPEELASCTHEQLEADLQSSPFTGTAVRANGTLAPGRYVISSTYLRLKPEAAGQARFQELMGPISQALEKQPGLMALRLGMSARCKTARTLSVWRDEAAMYEFVAGPVHSQAIMSVDEVSRGGSIVTHWEDDERGVSWEKATQQLVGDLGPFY